MAGDELMSRSLRKPRAAAIAGVLFALLLTATLALIRLATPSDAGEVGPWLIDPSRNHMIVLALHHVPFAGIAFLRTSDSPAQAQGRLSLLRRANLAGFQRAACLRVL